MIPMIDRTGSWRPWLVVMALALLTVGAAWWLKAPCAGPARWNGRFEYSRLCYNEFVPLWSARGFSRGLRPYIDAPFEYPALSGAAAWLANQGGGGARGFFERMALLLALAALVSVLAFAEARGGPDWRAYAYALAPPTVLYLFQNFDQLAVAPALVGVVALRRRRVGWAGVAFGIGAAVKLFPALVAAGAALALFGARRRREAVRLGAATALAFAAANLPFLVANPRGWWATWAFHAGRLVDWGSPLYWLGVHTGWSAHALTRVADLGGGLVFAGGLAALAWRCARRPMAPVQAGAFVLALFLAVNKVASPQYALWILPFIVLLELPVGWFAAFCLISTGELVGKLEWFGSAAGVAAPDGFTHLFEAMVWARFVYTVALTLRLWRADATDAADAGDAFVPPADAGAPCELAPGDLAPAPAPHPGDARWRGWARIVLALAALVYVARLGDPPTGAPYHRDYVHDECYQAFTAHRYALGDPEAWNPRATRATMQHFLRDDVTRSTAYEWVHPPTAKLIMALGIRLFGFRAVAYRLGSCLFGLLLLFATWRLGARLGGERYAAVALLLLAADGLTFLMSRIAMNDIYAVACLVPATFAIYRYWTDGTRRRRWLVAAGALFGVGLSMKWSVLPLFIECSCVTLGRIVWDALRRPRRARALALDVAAWLTAFVALPVALYVAAYTPYFLAGHPFAGFVDILHQERWYHAHLHATHSYGSRWYGWPLILRPVWFYVRRVGTDGIAVIYAFGNPLLWWAFLPSLAFVGWRFCRTRRAGDGLILMGFFGSWLPWMLVPRVAFIQYLLPAVPFGVLAVASAVQALAARRLGRRLAAIYVVGCVALFVHFYPIWSGLPVSARALAGHRWLWFPGWR